MKEIKYRGFQKTKEGYVPVYGCGVHVTKTTCTLQTTESYNEKRCVDVERSTLCKGISVGPVTFYEHDIVEARRVYNSKNPPELYKVVFEVVEAENGGLELKEVYRDYYIDGSFNVKRTPYNTSQRGHLLDINKSIRSGEHLYVVGNTFQNSELLLERNTNE